MQERKKIERSNQEIKTQPKELRKRLENEQILSVLQGNININTITSSNSNLQRYITEFKRNFPKSQIEYQGILSVSFRDFLIEQPELKPIIDNMMKKQRLYGKDDEKHEKVYDFIDDFYNDNGRTPNSLELYQKFLNFKGYELRGKINYSRKLNPDYNRKAVPKEKQNLNKISKKRINKLEEPYGRENLLSNLENKPKSVSLKEIIKEREKEDIEFKEDLGWELKESEELAEMVGIGLGDGSVPHDKTRFRVTLNRSQEPQYAMFVYNLMKKTLNRIPSIYEPKDADAIKFTMGRKKMVEKLIDKGLKPGDKKVNQVDVPQWINVKRKYQKGVLRGLVGTDGSIHIHKSQKKIRISFKNASQPLVKDFKDLCEVFAIKTGKIYPVKGKNTYQVAIETKHNVGKFIDNIQPRKWENKAETLGLVLKSISDPERRVKIEEELIKKYPDKKVHYSYEYKQDLKYLCKKYGYDVSNEPLIKEIEIALTYKDSYTGLTQERKNQLNIYAKKIIDDLKKRWK